MKPVRTRLCVLISIVKMECSSMLYILDCEAFNFCKFAIEDDSQIRLKTLGISNIAPFLFFGKNFAIHQVLWESTKHSQSAYATFCLRDRLSHTG